MNPTRKHLTHAAAIIALPALVLCVGTPSICGAAQNSELRLETDTFIYVIGTNGSNVSFVDRGTGVDHLKHNESAPCALVSKAGKHYTPESAVLVDDSLRVKFRGIKSELVLKTEKKSSSIVFTLEGIEGEPVDSVVFVNVATDLAARPTDAFGACALALNLPTKVDALPALQSYLRAEASARFGLKGAHAALVAAPVKSMLPALKLALESGSELPVCKVAGPWAAEVPFNHGSYVFNFGSLTESNLTEWIDLVHSLGFTQIDNHGGPSFFRFGELELDRKKWPDGWDGWARIVDRLHKEGIGSIFHTYCYFIDKQCKYVTPVPDSRLDTVRTFTLSGAIAADATEIPVNESTAGLSTVTGFFEHNSVTLHIGDELVTFGGFAREAPWKFTQVKRGALGTKAAAHEAGAKARHLKELFGLFVPDPESTLFVEIAAKHAEVVNRCGFDGIYLDAIDGSSILRGGGEAWYWGSKFVVEIQKRLQRPTGMEMSAMWHHFWQYRSRWQAWDLPQRGHVRFIDIHADAVNGGLLLPLHLGWWGFQKFDPPQIDPLYPEVMETVAARLVGWDAGMSLAGGVGLGAFRQTPLFARGAAILKESEGLRTKGVFDSSAREKLREKGAEFRLVKAGGGSTFRRSQSQSHTVDLSDQRPLSWAVTNAFAAQQPEFRIEALMSVDPGATNSRVLLDASSMTRWTHTQAAGVAFTSTNSPVNEGAPVVILSATNAGQVPQTAAWGRIEKTFDPPLDLKALKGLVCELETGNSGALLAIRLESPVHLSFGAFADHYVDLNFSGRRTVSLVESESSRWSDYTWNDNKSAYNAYRETIDFGAVSRISIWLQNLPAGQTTSVKLQNVRAVPIVAATLKNPELTIGGKKLALPADLAPGSWIEARDPAHCTIYDASGKMLGAVTPKGEWPKLSPGATQAGFAAGTNTPASRARATVFTLGEEVSR